MKINCLAQLYDKFFGENLSDLEFFKYCIDKNDGVALEIGSGTGRLLLELAKAGLSVEGIEPNQDMINLCLEKAKLFNLSPVIYKQKLQNLNLQKKYKTIYLPLYVFQQIIEPEEINLSLKNLYDHLDAGGQILISIFLPWNDPTGTWEQTWRVRQSIFEDDSTFILSESVQYNKFTQIQSKILKYEFFKQNCLKDTLLLNLNYKTYSIGELTLMLKQNGFKNIQVFGDYTFQVADSNTEAFVFKAEK